MKKLLLLLLMLYSGVQAQTINLSDYAKKSDFDKLTTKVDRQQKTIDSLIAILNGVKPPVALKKCAKGPTIVEIKNVTSKGFDVQFDADSVFNMKYMVTGAKVYIDSIKPTKNTFAVIFPTQFPNGTYTFSIEGINCSGSNSRIFTIAGGVDPPSTADCKKQPTFKINGFTNEAATIQFDADGLKTLTLSLVQGTETIKTISYNPDVNTLFFPFGKVIPAGNYKIKLTPVSCTAEPRNQEFSIKNQDTGEVDPPIETDPGAADYKLITKGMRDHISITRRTVGDIDFITDNTANDLHENYQYRYIVGADIVLQPNPLKDYAVARNNGFRVVKFLSKVGISSINEWPGQGQDGSVPGGYYKNDAGQSFVYNASAGVESGFFGGSQSGFVNHIPANFNPGLQMPQWADISPEARLPKDRFFILSRGDWSIDQVTKKGITHVRHHEIPRPNGDETLAFQLRLQGKTYSDVPLSTTIFGGKPSDHPTPEEVQRMIDLHQYPDALHIGETMEQSHAIDPSKTWLKDFNEGFVSNQRKLFDSKGIKSLNCFNYFQFWPPSYHLGQVSAETSKRLFRLLPDEMPYSNFSPGAPLSTTNLIVEAVYLDAPDIQQKQPLDLAFKLMLFEHMGYDGGVFLAPEHEWRPNNFFENSYPEGKYFNQAKIPLDPNTIITSVFFSQVFGKVFVQWGGGAKINEGRIFNPLTPEPTYWLQNGSGEMKSSYRNPDPNAERYMQWIASPDFPYARRGAGYYGYNAGADLCRFGLQVYLDTWGQIPEDGSVNFLTFRIDDGDWIKVANTYADDIIDAYVRKGGFVHSIHKGGKIAWYYINPYADNLWHNLEVRFPNGRTVKNRVAGNGIHAKIESL
ncbi:hypothetical protein [Dyadobacter diqingensis]|uniref:hypothetical protein n=1 Tax=Dyadobacter diqingensis TaxID=2938121 RepID=UPI0020C3E7A1|nr:hypothetical protein [Dyadobacter diqingensis]